MRFQVRTLLIAVAVVAAALVGVRGCIDWLDPFAGRSFDRELWHRYRNNDDRDNPRGSMVRSLQRWYLEPGMTHEQVVELLGEPDMGQILGDERSNTPQMYEYNLGMWSGFRIDYDGLQIYFDQTGHLTDSQCVQH